MRAPSLVLLLGFALLAGCSSDPESGPAEAGPAADGPRTGHPTWVHHAGGILLNASAYPGGLPSFEQLHVTDRISGEPTIGITRTSAVFYPAIDFDVGAVATTLPSTRYFRSVDGGATWQDYSPKVATVETHPTSFDPYVYTDPTAGRVFALDMGPHVACNQVSWSADDGRTWVTRPGACPTPVADHPTLFAARKVGPDAGAPPLPSARGYPHNLFLCSNQVADVQCSLSPDGGATWLPSQPVFLGVEPENVGEDPMALDWLCGSLHGHGYASWVDGTVYLGKAHCSTIMAGVSRDGGLNWEATIIAQGTEYAPRGEHDVSIQTDLNGTAYAFWIGNGTTAWLAVSHDQGRTWGTPLDVTAPGVTAAKLPSLAAGAKGRIAVQYVATTTPSGWELDAENRTEFLNATWDAYVTLSLDADAADPVFATTTANDVSRPLKRGLCEGRCMGDVGGMYDFLDIEFDPMTGRVWSALVDVCTNECDEAGADADTVERAMGAVGKQTGGTFLLDAPYPHASELPPLR